MHSHSHPFLYDNLLDRIIAGTGSRSRWHLYGGRGLGKTVLLRRLQAQLVPSRRFRTATPPDRTNEVTWVDARTERPRSVIQAWCKAPKGMLIADDFDLYLDLNIDDRVRELIMSPGHGARIVVTTRERPEQLERRVMAERLRNPSTTARGGDESPCFATFYRERLNPWLGDHRAALRSAHHNAFGSLRRTLSWLVDDEARPASRKLPGEDALRPWVEVVGKVTGGHPALVDAAFDLLLVHWLEWLMAQGKLHDEDLGDHHLAQYATQRPRTGHALFVGMFEHPREQGEHAQERLGVLLADYLGDQAMPTLERAMWRLRESHPDVFMKMQFMAEEPGTSAITDQHERRMILASGLAYKDDEGRLYVPEGLIASSFSTMDPPTMEGTEATSRGVGEPTGTGRVLGVTVEASGEQRGALVVRTTTGPDRVELHGRPWQVLWFLYQNRDEVHAVPAIRKAVGFPQDGAVRFAISKLREHLRKAGYDGVPENVSKKGYRFGGMIERVG